MEDRARRDGGAAAPVVDRSRRGYTRRSRWRAGPTQRRHPVVDQGPADIKPAAGVMDRRRSGQSQSLVSGSRGLRIAGLQQPAGPRHSPAPTEWGEGRRTDRTAPRWGRRRAGSSGPLTKMFRYWSFSRMCRCYTGYNSGDVLSHRFTLSL